MTEREYDEECCDPELVTRKSKRGDTLLFQVQCYAPGQQQPESAMTLFSRRIAPASRAMGASSPSSIVLNATSWFFQFTAKYQTSDQDSQAVARSTSTSLAPNVITFVRGASQGLIQVSVGPQATLTLGDGPTRLVYDVKGMDPSGNVFTMEEGIWIVRPDVTRAIVGS